MKKLSCHKQKIIFLVLFLLIPLIVINCKKKYEHTLLPERMKTDSADRLFNELAAAIIKESRMKNGILVEADSINGRLSIAISKKAKFEIYALTTGETGYSETLENIKTSGDC